MNLKEEYDQYLERYDKYKGYLISNSGDEVSKALMQIEGINFRVGQILADLEIEYMTCYNTFKVDNVTDKLANSKSITYIFDRHTIGLKHFERMNKSFDSMIKSLKKRLRVLEMELNYGS